MIRFVLLALLLVSSAQAANVSVFKDGKLVAKAPYQEVKQDLRGNYVFSFTTPVVAGDTGGSACKAGVMPSRRLTVKNYHDNTHTWCLPPGKVHGMVWFDRTGYSKFSEKLVAISKQPGDFNVDARCKRQGWTGTIYTGDNRVTCPVEPNTAYYINVKDLNCRPGDSCFFELSKY